jgi:ATP-dependent Clp protease ATP-binding subunit ClpA
MVSYDSSMFERFTPRARRVIVLAQDAARDMGHPQIKPEHLLLGLQQGEGMAANAMAQCGVDGAALRLRVAEIIKATPSARKLNRVPFSPEAKKTLELSLRAALALGHNYIGTEHILLGVERQAEQGDHDLDELLGITTSDLHNRLMEMLGGATGAPSMRSPAVELAMSSARHQAGEASMTTGHLLASMVGDADSQAARALTALGITSEAVLAAIADVPVAQTSDATPAAQSVAITIGQTTTLIGDPELAAALEQLSAAQLRGAIKKAIGLVDPDQAAG